MPWPQVHTSGFDLGPEWLSAWQSAAKPLFMSFQQEEFPNDSNHVQQLLNAHGRLVERCWLAPQLSQPTSQPPTLQAQPLPNPDPSCSSQAVPSANHQGTSTSAVASLQCHQRTQQTGGMARVEQDSYDCMLAALECVTHRHDMNRMFTRAAIHNLMDASPALHGLALAMQV